LVGDTGTLFAGDSSMELTAEVIAPDMECGVHCGVHPTIFSHLTMTRFKLIQRSYA